MERLVSRDMQPNRGLASTDYNSKLIYPERNMKMTGYSLRGGVRWVIPEDLQAKVWFESGSAFEAKSLERAVIRSRILSINSETDCKIRIRISSKGRDRKLPADLLFFSRLIFVIVKLNDFVLIPFIM